MKNLKKHWLTKDLKNILLKTIKKKIILKKKQVSLQKNNSSNFFMTNENLSY